MNFVAEIMALFLPPWTVFKGARTNNLLGLHGLCFPSWILLRYTALVRRLKEPDPVLVRRLKESNPSAYHLQNHQQYPETSPTSTLPLGST